MVTRISRFGAQTEKTDIERFVSEIRGEIAESDTLRLIDKIRKTTNKEERSKLKSLLPLYFLGGDFSKQGIDGLKEPSGYLVLDFDNFGSQKEAADFRDKIAKDDYVVCAFVSVSALGVGAVVRTAKPKDNEDNHLIYSALSEYYADIYDYIADPACADISRARFISLDPSASFSPNCKVWEKRIVQPTKKDDKVIKSLSAYPFGLHDLRYVCDQISEMKIGIVNNYAEYMTIAFALSNEFGEDGREYFHKICENSSKGYNFAKREKQYNSALNYDARTRARKVTFGSFLKICKDNGIKVQTAETQAVISRAFADKINGKTVIECIKNIEKVDGISQNISEKIAKTVYLSEDVPNPTEKIPPRILAEKWLKSLKIKFNELNLCYEIDGKELDENALFTLHNKFCKEILLGKEYSFNNFSMILRTEEVSEKYDPAVDFFGKFASISAKGEIKKLAAALKSPTGASVRSDFVEHFLRKWLVSLIAISNGFHANTMLVLAGEKGGTGKTHFFRTILPKELSKYKAETRFSFGKDDFILCVKNILVVIDDAEPKDLESGGMLKELTSKDVFDVRLPYGREMLKLPRRCVFGATTNRKNIITDTADNRRIVTFEINDDIFDDLEKIDKFLLWAEAYDYFQKWRDSHGWLFNRKEVEELQKSSGAFVQLTFEQITLIENFEQSKNSITVSEILAKLREKSFANMNNLTSVGLGKQLKALYNLDSVEYAHFKAHNQRGYARYFLKLKDEFYN